MTLLKHYYKQLDEIHNITGSIKYTIQNDTLISNFAYDNKRLEVIRDIHNNNWNFFDNEKWYQIGKQCPISNPFLNKEMLVLLILILLMLVLESLPE